MQNAGAVCPGVWFSGGDDGVRTHDLRLAKPALSQLSYVPVWADGASEYNNRPSGDSANAGATIVRKWWA